MTDLRQQALKAVEEMPEKNLLVLLNLIQEQNLNPPRRKIDISQFAGKAGNLFGSVEEVENYIKEQRDWERKF